ncbi:MAG: hypothetical protein FJ042_01075 [Candidatus Cloacimonetes bacterium]|nr:hypothetical protein [Candidatus Cloacimonadota bacterium]
MMSIKRTVCYGLFIILLGITPSVIHAYLRPESGFYPQIRSQIKHSFLQENDTYRIDRITPAEPGLHHPFHGLRDLGDAIAEYFSPGDPQSAMCLYSVNDEGLKLHTEMNVIAGGDLFQHDDYDYSFLYKGIRFNTYILKGIEEKHSSVYDGFGMRALWWNGGFWGDLNGILASPLVDGYYKHNESRIDIDNLTADIYYNHPRFTLAIGRGRFQTGNSISGSIILNDTCNDYGYFLAEGFTGPFTLSFMHGSLIADSILALYDNASVNHKNLPDKYIATHQITYETGDRWRLFAGETIIYGKRGLEINYLLPHTFWRVTEHNQHDRDNVLIYAGGSFRPHPRVLLYGQAFLDELRYAELFGNWWGNKYALQGGINLLLANPAVLHNQAPQITLEVSAVRPWSYTHYLDYNKYSHDRRSLGYPKGANLLDLSCELNLPLLKTLRWDSHASYTKQGSTGNNYSLNYAHLIPDIDTTQTRWFEGNVTKTLKLTSNLAFAGMAHHRFLIGITSTYVINWKHAIFGSWQMSF